MADKRVSEQFHKDCRNGVVQKLIIESGYNIDELMRRYNISRSCVTRAKVKYDLPTPRGFYKREVTEPKDTVSQSKARSLAMSGAW